MNATLPDMTVDDALAAIHALGDDCTDPAVLCAPLRRLVADDVLLDPQVRIELLTKIEPILTNQLEPAEVGTLTALEELARLLERLDCERYDGNVDDLGDVVEQMCRYLQRYGTTWRLVKGQADELDIAGVPRDMERYYSDLAADIDRAQRENPDGITGITSSIEMVLLVEMVRAYWLQADVAGGVVIVIGPESTFREERDNPVNLVLHEVYVSLAIRSHADAEQLPDEVADAQPVFKCREVVIDTDSGHIVSMSKLERLPM